MRIASFLRERKDYFSTSEGCVLTLTRVIERDLTIRERMLEIG